MIGLNSGLVVSLALPRFVQEFAEDSVTPFEVVDLVDCMSDDFIAVQLDSLVKLSWTQANMHISGFVIERSVDGGDWSSVATLTKTENTWSDSNILGGNLYTYRIDLSHIYS